MRRAALPAALGETRSTSPDGRSIPAGRSSAPLHPSSVTMDDHRSLLRVCQSGVSTGWLGPGFPRVLLGVLLLALSACQHTQPTLADTSWLAGLEPPESLALETPDGSLWVETGTTSALFADRRACKPGDVITVEVIEEAKAKKTASTTTKRSSSTDASVNALLGIVKSVTDHNPDMGSSFGIGAATDNSYAGQGETLREGSLTTTFTVRVMQVLPNGHLVIAGSRSVKVNNEVQILALRGLVDPRDISVDNSVESTKIAEAQIEFFGQGVVGDKQHPGWLQRGLDWVWPF